jgi:enoyl-[acyl-carrier protein] reductase III
MIDWRARTLEVNDRTYAAWNAHDPDAVAAVFAPDAVLLEAGRPEPFRGRDAIRERARALLTAFPDLTLERIELVIDRDRHADRWVMTGTHRGDLLGLAPTGRRVRVEGATFTRLGAEGLVAQDVHFSDTMSSSRSSAGRQRPRAVALQTGGGCAHNPPMPLALVTGGSRGIGRAIVERLARDGADVAFVYRRDAAAAAQVDAVVRALGRRCVPLKADLGNPADVLAALDQLGGQAVDIFVANAAATAFKPLLEIKPHHLEKTYAITIGAFLAIVQRIAPTMPAGGRIVAISGMDTHRFVAGHGVLASAKAALEALTRYLAVELGPRGITVNAVNPGYVETDSVTMYLGDEAGRRAFLEEIEGSTPLRALGAPDEVASLVAFLCSPEASWMQGQVLYLDGGIFLHAPGHSVRWWKRMGRMP